MKKFNEIKENLKEKAAERKELKAARKEAFEALPLDKQEEIKAARVAKVTCCVVAGAAVATVAIAAINTARQNRAENVDYTGCCDTTAYAGVANLY